MGGERVSRPQFELRFSPLHLRHLIFGQLRISRRLVERLIRFKLVVCDIEGRQVVGLLHHVLVLDQGGIEQLKGRVLLSLVLGVGEGRPAVLGIVGVRRT